LWLPDELRRMYRNAFSGAEHQDVQVHRLLPLQGPKLLPQIRVLQKHLLPARSVLLLHVELLHVPALRQLLLHGVRLLRVRACGKLRSAEWDDPKSARSFPDFLTR
jgi:hypothetical protein